MDPVTLFHIEMGKAAQSAGAEIDVGLWLDLAGSTDRRDQIFACGFAGDHLGVSGLGTDHGKADNSCHGQNYDNDNDNFLQAHFPGGRFASITFGGNYAKSGRMVPEMDVGAWVTPAEFA